MLNPSLCVMVEWDRRHAEGAHFLPAAPHGHPRQSLRHPTGAPHKCNWLWTSGLQIYKRELSVIHAPVCSSQVYQPEQMEKTEEECPGTMRSSTWRSLGAQGLSLVVGGMCLCVHMWYACVSVYVVVCEYVCIPMRFIVSLSMCIVYKFECVHLLGNSA
jgi:hypothetical protein